MTDRTTTTATRRGATEPEDLARLFVERANAGDAEGIAELYEPDAVLAYPPGSRTVGREAIRAVLEQMLAQVPRFEVEPALPTVRNGDLAITSTRPADNTGGRVQVVRRQPDGTWLRVIDRPEIRD
ncbi:nuclear transport factor 2 family protein [Streptomyces sparsogenes]|uniref:YybH family protein n=1 Tax=Streptomyces sparsogenes TaxID=67365 RepID=UPI0033C725BF